LLTTFGFSDAVESRLKKILRSPIVFSAGCRLCLSERLAQIFAQMDGKVSLSFEYKIAEHMLVLRKDAILCKMIRGKDVRRGYLCVNGIAARGAR
jgi:hypothetical protein